MAVVHWFSPTPPTLMPRVYVRAPWSRHVRPAKLSQPAGRAGRVPCRASVSSGRGQRGDADGFMDWNETLLATRVVQRPPESPRSRDPGAQRRGGGATSPRHSAIALGLGANARAAPGRERMRCAGPGRRHVRAHGFLAGSSFNQQWLTAELGHPGRIWTVPYLFTH